MTNTEGDTMAEEAGKIRAEYAKKLRQQMNMTVGDNVARARKAKKMSQEELGQALGDYVEPVKAQTISFVERGRRELSPLELLAFAAALEVPASGLLLPPEGLEIPVYSEDWDAARIRDIVLGAKPALIRAASASEAGEATPKQLRDQLKEVTFPKTEKEGAKS
jgi:transcriptional regulator with XRE-family HTH domain